MASGYTQAVDFWSCGVIIYALLSGCTPWEEAPIDKFCRNLWGKGYLKFSPEHWGEVSEEAIDLVKRLLERDPSERIGGKNVMAHIWILSGREETRRLGLATPDHSNDRFGAEESVMESAAASAATTGKARKKRPLSKGYSARLRHVSVNQRSRKRAKRPII